MNIISTKLSDERDVPILIFLWKWKVVTTATLLRRFFPAKAGITGYLRLRKICNAGFIRQKADDDGKKFVWMLTAKGYKVVKQHLPSVIADGFRSEAIGHDLASCAFQLGDWIRGEPKGVETFSEQQLRCIDPEFYPDWVPRSRHRSDGYTKILANDKVRIFSFEVELTQKKSVQYEVLADQYSEIEDFAGVLWLVRTPNSAKKIHESLSKRLKGKPFVHNFIEFNEFINNGWLSRILIGPGQGRTMAYAMNYPEQNCYKTFCRDFLLNTRKSPYSSSSSRIFELGDFPLRLCPSNSRSHTISKDSFPHE